MVGSNILIFHSFFQILGHPDSFKAWRLSFSLIEKTIIKSLRINIKSALRLLESDLEKMRIINDLSVTSYHLKTILLHDLDEPDVDWEEIGLADMYERLLVKFQSALKRGVLRRYFLPDVNLMERVSKSECKDLYAYCGVLIEEIE